MFWPSLANFPMNFNGRYPRGQLRITGTKKKTLTGGKSSLSPLYFCLTVIQD
jgi:hypothetical protein